MGELGYMFAAQLGQVVMCCVQTVTWHGHWHSRLNSEGIQSKAIVTCRDLFVRSFPLLCAFYHLISLSHVYLYETNTVLFLNSFWIWSRFFPLKDVFMVVHLSCWIGACLQQTYWHANLVLASDMLAYGKSKSTLRVRHHFGADRLLAS